MCTYDNRSGWQCIVEISAAKSRDPGGEATEAAADVQQSSTRKACTFEYSGSFPRPAFSTFGEIIHTPVSDLHPIQRNTDRKRERERERVKRRKGRERREGEEGIILGVEACACG